MYYLTTINYVFRGYFNLFLYLCSDKGSLQMYPWKRAFHTRESSQMPILKSADVAPLGTNGRCSERSEGGKAMLKF